MPKANSRNHGSAYVLVSASSVVGIAATLAAGVLLARLLSVEDRGLVALVVYWAGFAAAFGHFSLSEAFIFGNREAGVNPRKMLPSLLATVIAVAAVVGTVAIGSIALFRSRFEGIDVDFAATIIALFILINFFNSGLIAVERASLNFRRIAFERALLPLLYSLALLIAALTDTISVEVVLVVFLATRLPVLLARLWRFRGSLFGRPRMAEIRNLLATGMRFHGVALLHALADQSDKIVVSLQWSATKIAYYAVSFSAAGAAFGLVSQALGLISLPVASKLAPEAVAKHFEQSIRILTILLSTITIPVILLAPLLIPLVFGEDYRPAVLYTQLIAAALFFVPVIGQVDAILKGRGEVRSALALHAVTVVVFALGWVVSGYGDIVTLCLGLAVSRIVALCHCILTLRGDLEGVKLRNCLIWRLEDFRLLLNTAGDMLPARFRRGV